MAWNWKILKAAVEQEILFPSKECFDDYIQKLTWKEEPFQVLSVTEKADGTVNVVMRKKYNNNAFFELSLDEMRE